MPNRRKPEQQIKIPADQLAVLARERLEFQQDVERLRAEVTRVRLTLSMLLDEIDSQYDGLSPGVWRAYSRAVEVLGKLRDEDQAEFVRHKSGM
jgi:hypothetical protein